MAKKSEYLWVWQALLLFILVKIIYEILGVTFAALAGETRAIVAAFVGFYVYTKVGDKIERLI